MNVNNLKLIIAAVIAVVLIGAVIFDADANASWAVPLLTLLVGYVIGNAQVTDQKDNIAPIVSLKPPPPPSSSGA